MDKPKKLLQVFTIFFNGFSIQTGSNPVCPMKKAFCNQRAFFYGLRLFRHSSLFWGDATDFVGVEKKVVGLADSSKFNVFLAGAAKMGFELFCKVGVTHAAFTC